MILLEEDDKRNVNGLINNQKGNLIFLSFHGNASLCTLNTFFKKEIQFRFVRKYPLNRQKGTKLQKLL